MANHFFKAHYASEIHVFLYSLEMFKHVFNNVLITDLEQVRCLTTEDSSVERAVMCHKGSKM
jgi:hypothetical protein